jgi:WD40 repeat protein
VNSEEIEADLSLVGHSDTVTGLALSPDGEHLLSNAMDSSLRSWDVRPFVAGSEGASGDGERCEKSYAVSRCIAAAGSLMNESSLCFRL